MDAPPVRYDRWKAPSEDGKVLLWPAPADLLTQTLDNQRRLSSLDSVTIQNVPVAQVRQLMRQWLGHDDAFPLIATGHQAELHHPGVWVKNALIDAAATALGGRAFHFAVDADAPKHLQLRWPGDSIPLTDDPEAARASWSGLVKTPSPAHLREIEQSFSQAALRWSYRPMVPEFLSSLRRLSLASESLAVTLTDALHELDWDLGLRYDAMIVSPICLSEPYLLFAYHLTARAEKFAVQYNAALARFRAQNKIKDPGRPMPDLRVSDALCEIPFWLDSLAEGTRSRAAVIRIGEKWVMRAGDGDEFVFDPEIDGWDAAGRFLRWLRKHGLRLSPRALTLTCVLRLLVADQFVHGIGGGQYDQVLDDLISRYFGVEPPRFSVTTATLYFPEAVGQPRVCLPCLLQESHRKRHSVLGEEKMRLVEQIAASPRRSAERSSLFQEMHARLSAASTLPQIRAWEDRIRQAEQESQEQRTLFDRELFYAIQPRERLTALIDRYRSAFR
jgi:hypothetical protein